MFGKAQTVRVLLLAAMAAAGQDRIARAQGQPSTNALPAVLVTGFKGAPSIQRGNRWFPLQVRELIPPGSNVRTGASDTLELMLDESGRVISFGSSSQANINLAKSTVLLESGEIVASIRKTTKGNTSLIIESPFGIITVRAADFQVAVQPVPSITVLDGTVEFEVARALTTAPALQLRDGAHVVAGPENPIVRVIDQKTRGFLTGRVDAMVSSQGALAEKFWPRPGHGTCHIPTVPSDISPEGRPGRLPGSVNVEQYSAGAFAMQSSSGAVSQPAGASSCPIHGRQVEAAAKAAAPVAKPKPWEQ